MQTFKITFMRNRGEVYQGQCFEADSTGSAIAKLGRYWTIRSITVQCSGHTIAGEPCQRFTHDEYCCKAHEPKPERKPYVFDTPEAESNAQQREK